MINSIASDTNGGSSSGGVSVDTAIFQLALDDARIQDETKSISAAIILSDGTELKAVSNEEGDPYAVTPEMNFSIASATKMFIAACVLKLVEERKLSLDDTLQKLLYDPDIPNTKHKLNSSFKSKIAPLIRVRDLLNHTTGIDDFLGDQYYTDLAITYSTSGLLLKRWDMSPRRIIPMMPKILRIIIFPIQTRIISCSA